MCRTLAINEKTYLEIYRVRYALQVYFLIYRLGYCSFEEITCAVLNTHPHLSPVTAERAVRKVISLFLEKGVVVPSERGIKRYKINKEVIQ